MIENVVRICPRCQERYSAPNYTIDFEHICSSGDNTIDQEDIEKLGDYTDDDGNSQTVQNPFLQGIDNELNGTRAGIEGEDSEPTTDRGARESTHRVRQHTEFIELKS